MQAETPYNPLEKKNLGISVADALLQRPLGVLPPPEPFIAAGLYALYYKGRFPAYKPISLRYRGDKKEVPIYVGKAIPKGGRKGIESALAAGPVLYNRLAEHGESIAAAENLEVADFRCRYLAVDDIWIPLGESLLIQTFAPVWNIVLDGFGNHDPGAGRHAGEKPRWDVVHPGRVWADRMQKSNKRSAEELLHLISRHFASANRSSTQL
jgi:hypothetical protein